MNIKWEIYKVYRSVNYQQFLWLWKQVLMFPSPKQAWSCEQSVFESLLSHIVPNFYQNNVIFRQSASLSLTIIMQKRHKSEMFFLNPSINYRLIFASMDTHTGTYNLIKNQDHFETLLFHPPPSPTDWKITGLHLPLTVIYVSISYVTNITANLISSTQTSHSLLIRRSHL